MIRDCQVCGSDAEWQVRTRDYKLNVCFDCVIDKYKWAPLFKGKTHYGIVTFRWLRGYDRDDRRLFTTLNELAHYFGVETRGGTFTRRPAAVAAGVKG